MAENSISGDLGKGVVGAGIGFALYLFITGLELGWGGGGRGRGEGSGRGETKAPPASEGSGRGPTQPLLEPLVPSRPKDASRLSFVMTHPTFDDPSLPMSFRGPDARAYSLDEMIARIKTGGRSDVVLKTAGNVREGSASSATARVKQAGIEVWKEDGVRVSGNARGSYG